MMRTSIAGSLLVAGLLLTNTVRAQVVVPPTPGKAPAPAPLDIPKPMAQPAKSAPYGAGMKINISADGSKYVRLMTAVQFWARYNENNSNTTNASEQLAYDQTDFGIRRARLLLVSQLNSRFVIITQLGVNSQSTISGGVPGETTGPGKKSLFYLHDAMVDYKVNKYLSFGGGLHAYNGISRQTSFAAFSLLTLDVPGTQWPVLDAIDQTGRGLGLFAHGRVGKFDYRLSVNDAYKSNTSSTPATLATGVAQFNPRARGKVYQGYFTWEFLDKEANLVPFTVGCYLGSRRVLNIGTGFLYYGNGMYMRPDALPTKLPTDVWTIPTQQQDLSVLAADLFYDTPIDTTQKTSFTFYGAFYKYNMGSNLVRYAGNLNPGAGSAVLRGNALPVLGTGTAQTMQTGYVLPQRLLGPKVRLQPYADYIHGRYEGLRAEDGTVKDVHVFDGGVNVLLDNHNAKITLNYRARPDFSNTSDIVYRPEVTMQLQAIL